MSLTKSTITDEQFVKVRCSTDSRTYYFDAVGAMYAQPLDEDEPVHLFDFLGVDISRCIQDQATGRWILLSRKITLYLDPQTGQVLKQWRNPWSGETLGVMHRSYDYQEFPIPPQIKADVAPEISAVSLDFNLKLPNPLAANPKFADYSPEKYVQSADSYKFIFPTRLLNQEERPEDHLAVALSYYRMGPWEPWMKMKGKPGFLVLNYTGAKVDGFEALPSQLKSLIEQRMPLYREAPKCKLERSIATSWTRFEEQFDACLRGEEFPLPAPIVDEPCVG
ncbi:DUF1838 family protein [Iningainema tapete]|uniref:DUF1838 family protein n=1 Tax=Iningainema tapete BLCC-T55 TaxID=2748662 RepID=A0A8J6XHX6_9CYAN|nr:DUF1838 family protein [Iningainema tapete]MBD2776274.1 DUF1838 family protein [Iningainema tapete BLCC-T55]